MIGANRKTKRAIRARIVKHRLVNPVGYRDCARPRIKHDPTEPAAGLVENQFLAACNIFPGQPFPGDTFKRADL